MTSSPTISPWTDVKRSHDEHAWLQEDRMRYWRAAACFCAAMLALSLGCNAVQLARQKLSIWVVGVSNETGRVMMSGPAEHRPAIDDRLRRAALGTWITSLRIVTTDDIVARRQVLDVFAMVASGSQADTTLREYFDPNKGGTSPFERAQTGTVEVQVESIVSSSDRAYEVRWKEVARDLNGALKSTEHWTAAVTLDANPPKDEAQAAVNPLGLLVSHFSASRITQ